MNGDEHELNGGIYGGDERTDFILQESGPGINEAAGEPMTFDLKIVTGNAVYALTQCSPDDVIRLGKWLMDVAHDVQRRQDPAAQAGA